MSARLRPRLSRTVAAARWREYRDLLESALDAGYRVVSLEDWVLGGASDPLVLAVRHDVDQHPGSALVMARIERELGIRTTWYFRWRTADPEVVRAVRDAGATVGLHYETLSRLAIARGATDERAVAGLLPEAEVLLRDEVRAFRRAHGPMRSICPHGDSRVPNVRNARLLERKPPGLFDVDFDANDAMRGRGLAHWLTDRSAAEGRWANGTRPADLLAAGVSPILAVVHPNNWVSGPSLWADRLLGALLPGGDQQSEPGSPRRPLRTGSDAPPL